LVMCFVVATTSWTLWVIDGRSDTSSAATTADWSRRWWADDSWWLLHDGRVRHAV